MLKHRFDFSPRKQFAPSQPPNFFVAFLNWAATNFLLIVFLLAAIPRALLGIFAPYDGLDWPVVYNIVADNIYLHQCVSQSPPLSGACAPHWGGNQLPGFPAFVAYIWWVFGKNNLAVLLAQSAITGAAICWLTHAVKQLTNSTRISISVGLLTALSPVSVGWARSLNTECLAIAATIWVLAELLLSLAQKRIRIFAIGVALACATFIRFDNVFLCILVVVASFTIYSPIEALRRGVAVAIVFAIPLLLWTGRSIALGLPPVPSMNVAPAMNPDGSVPYPTGIKKYFLSWLIDATDMRTFSMPAYNGSYQEMRVPDRAFDSDLERQRIHALLAKLTKLRNKPIPKEIDDQFNELALSRYAHNPMRQIVRLPLARLKSLWINPFYSWGLPIGFEKAEISIAMKQRLDKGGTGALIQAALENPVSAIGKGLANGYLISLLATFFWVLVTSLVKPTDGALSFVLKLALTLAFARSVFLVSVGQVETRYIVECIPLLEVAVVFSLAERGNRKLANNGAVDVTI